MKIALVSCGEAKRSYPCRAEDLYIGKIYLASLKWAKANADRIIILSGKHGALDPDQIIAPYEFFLGKKSKIERQQWAKNVARQLEGKINASDKVIFLAGKTYSEYLTPLLRGELIFDLYPQGPGKVIQLLTGDNLIKKLGSRWHGK